MKARPEPRDGAAGAIPPVAVVVSRYNSTVTSSLLDGAKRAFAQRGGREQGLSVVEAPGAFELPALCLAAARTGRFAGVVALGCLVKGETRHDRYIAGAVAQGLVDITVATGVPVCFGVLTVDTVEQAVARSGGAKGNKGADAMEALIETMAAMNSLRAGRTAARTTPKPDKVARAASR